MSAMREMLLAAHRQHQAARAAYDAEHPFDFRAALDTPPPPQPSAYAEAGALIAERGVLGAAAAMLITLASRDLDERQRHIATLIGMSLSERAHADYEEPEPELTERYELRIDAPLKAWTKANGGDRLVRALLRAARAQQEDSSR